MHELSIAESVVRVVERHAAGRPVVRVELAVGHLRQVVPSALTFAWELVSEGTVAAGSELAIEQVSATVGCRRCGGTSTLEAFPATCGACGGLDVQVSGGDELRVEALELEEQEAIRSGG